MTHKRIFILVLLAASAACANSRHSEGPSDEIEYRGQKIKLSKAYSDYDDYKNDPENIHPSETKRVQHLVMEVPIEKRFNRSDALIQSPIDLAFPGYGSTLFSEQRQKDGSVLTGFCIEIPRAEQERCAAYREVNGAYDLIDDFVVDAELLISNVNQADDTLVYSGADGKPIITRPLSERTRVGGTP